MVSKAVLSSLFSHRNIALMGCVAACALLVTACQSPGWSSKKQDGVFVAGTDKAKKKGAKPTPIKNAGPGWNPSPGLARGSVGRNLSYSRVPMSEPYIALTFDDGPHPTNTPRLLDILKARNVKATFYVVGTNSQRYPAILRRMIAEGHEIGNHTLSHGYLTKMSNDTIRREFNASHQAIVSATGVAPRTMRPPYGAITSAQKAWIKSEFGYPTIMWSVDPEDWKKPGSSVVTRRLVSGASPGGILLVHDIHAPTITAIPSALDQLIAKGYRFVTVTQLIGLEGRG